MLKNQSRKKNILLNQHGYALVEMLIAISLVTIALLGIIVLVNRSTGLNRVTADQYVATYLAAEGLELARNIFDHTYLKTAQDFPGHNEFYGWAAPSGAFDPSDYCVIPNCTLIDGYDVYFMDYDDQALSAAPCTMSSSVPTDAELRDLLFSCSAGQLNYDVGTGLYSHNFGGTPTKFKRLIIIDDPSEYSAIPQSSRLDYRVTSAVAWETRGGGRFVVHLQDHFLPWRLP